MSPVLTELLEQALQLKPSEIASTLASLVGQVAAIVDRLDGDSDDLAHVKRLLESTRAYAEAAKQVLGGYSLEELAAQPSLYAGGSGRERLEADLLAEARGESTADLAPTPAPSGTKNPGQPPP